MTKFSQKELRYLREQPVGRLATVSRRGIPHVVALCFAADEDRLYLNTDIDSKKGRNIREVPNVSFIVDDWISWDEHHYILISGEAMFLKKGEYFRIGRDLIYRKYPQWEEAYPIEEGSGDILIITPKRVSSFGL